MKSNANPFEMLVKPTKNNKNKKVSFQQIPKSKKTLTYPYKINDVYAEDIYEGEVRNGMAHGYGYCKYGNGNVYEGYFVNDKRHGKGTLRYKRGGSYVGRWAYDKKHGQGVNIFANGDKYEGQWSKNQRHGEGCQEYSTGESYTGTWSYDEQHGIGKFVYADGKEYHGACEFGQNHGYGELKYPDGSVFKGYFVDGCKHRKGAFITKAGANYETVWKNGECVKKSDEFPFEAAYDQVFAELESNALVVYQSKESIDDADKKTQASETEFSVKKVRNMLLDE